MNRTFQPIARSGAGMAFNPQAHRTGNVGAWEVIDIFADREVERRSLAESVVLVDASAVAKYRIQGAEVFPEAPADMREIVFLDSVWVTRVHRTEWYLVAPLDAPRTLLELRAEVESRGGVLTDVTHGLDVLELTGPLSAEALARLCSIDLRRLESGQAETGGLARIKGLIARIDRGTVRSYQVHVDRSYGAYLWETLADIVALYGGCPAGQQAHVE